MSGEPSFPAIDAFRSLTSSGLKPKFALTALVLASEGLRGTKYVTLVARIARVQAARRASDGSTIPHALEV